MAGMLIRARIVWRRLICAVLLSSAPLAHAAPFTFPVPIFGTGLVFPLLDPNQPPPTFPLALANTAYTIGGVPGWTMQILNWTYTPAESRGSGDFVFSNGVDSIFGTGEQLALEIELADPGTNPFFGAPLRLEHSYLVTGGTGVYAGFEDTGARGFSLVVRTAGTPFYVEQGAFVPEPATALLAGVAVLGLLLGSRRRGGGAASSAQLEPHHVAVAPHREA